MNEQTDENDTETMRHGDGDRKPVQRGIKSSTWPGVPVPATVLACQIGDKAMFLHARRNGPSAYVCADGAALPQKALAAAFGSAPSSDTSATS